MIEINGRKLYMHCSQLAKIMSGSWGLTESQKTELSDLEMRKDGNLLGKNGKPLSYSERNQKDYERLLQIRDNPELPQGAKTYIYEQVVKLVYGYTPEIYSPETSHGNECEPLSINQLTSYFNAVMRTLYGDKLANKFEKNDIREYDNELMLSGEIDLLRITDKKRYGIDVKNPYSVLTFNKAKLEILKDYEYQGKSYCHLYDLECVYFIYTLNENKYMIGDEYDHLNQLEKMHIYRVDRDPSFIEEYKLRLHAIKDYAIQCINDIKASTEQTKKFVMEIAELEKRA